MDINVPIKAPPFNSGNNLVDIDYYRKLMTDSISVPKDFMFYDFTKTRMTMFNGTKRADGQWDDPVKYFVSVELGFVGLLKYENHKTLILNGYKEFKEKIRQDLSNNFSKLEKGNPYTKDIMNSQLSINEILRLKTEMDDVFDKMTLVYKRKNRFIPTNII